MSDVCGSQISYPEDSFASKENQVIPVFPRHEKKKSENSTNHH